VVIPAPLQVEIDIGDEERIDLEENKKEVVKVFTFEKIFLKSPHYY
jgi:hypothetical protein